MMDYKLFTDHIKELGFTYAKVFTTDGELFALYTDRAGSKTTQEKLAAGMEKIKNTFGGVYSVQCKRYPSDHDGNACTYQVDFGPLKSDKKSEVLGPQKVAQSGHSTFQSVDIEAMTEKIQTAVIAAQKEREGEQELVRLTEENAYLKEPAGILTEVIRIVGAKAEAKGYKLSTRSGTVLQGSGAAPEQPAQTTNGPRYDLLNNDSTEKKSSDLDQALINFKGVGVSDDYLLQLSERVKAKPELVNTVSNLLNIKM